jgi:membrane protein
MTALIFFFIIGLGLVIGAHLNAALAETPHDALEGNGSNSGEGAG